MPEPLPDYLRELIASQHGVVAATQLTASGLSRSTISSRVRSGRWQRLHRGVFATFSGEPTRLAVLWAAVLAAGPGAMLSYQTAAELAQLTDNQADCIHLTVPANRRVSRSPGIVVHYSARAARAVHPARVPPQTRVEETVLDLAEASGTIDEACAWIFRALQRRRTTQAKLAAALRQRARIRWRRELTELMTLDAAGFDSVLERRYQRDVERPHGLPRGARQRQYRRGDHNEYRDVLYEEFGTAVELDGAAVHHPDTRGQDVKRDNAAAEAGIITLRYGWLDVTASPCVVAAQVASVLRTRGFAGEHPCSPGCPVAAAQANTDGNGLRPTRTAPAARATAASSRTGRISVRGPAQPSARSA